MDNIVEYKRLMYGEFVGWVCDRRVYKDLTRRELDQLVGWLTHRKSRVRWSVADRLGKLERKRAVRPLIRALQDLHWLVRLHAAKALGRIGDPRALEPLLRVSDDECAFVRRRAIVALAQFRKKRVVKRLVSALSDPDKKVRAYAANGLGESRALGAVGVLAQAVCDQDTNVSWRAAYALGQLGPVSINALLALLDEPDKGVQYRALKMLERVGDARVVEGVATFLDNSDIMIQARARMALRAISFRHRSTAGPRIAALERERGISV